MVRPRVSASDRAYFRRLGEANEALREVDPAGSLAEVLARLERMERRLGALARPGRETDEGLRDAEARAIALHFRRGRVIAG